MALLMMKRLMKSTVETLSRVTTGPVMFPFRRSLAFIDRAILTVEFDGAPGEC